MKKIFVLTFVLLLLVENSCSKKSPSQTNNDDTSDGIVTWVSSARPPGSSLHIARTTSDGETSEITYLTDSPYCIYYIKKGPYFI